MAILKAREKRMKKSKIVGKLMGNFLENSRACFPVFPPPPKLFDSSRAFNICFNTTLVFFSNLSRKVSIGFLKK